MTTNISFINDCMNILRSPKSFFAERFQTIPARRLFIMGFLGTFVGLLVGSVVSFFFSDLVLADFAKNKEIYLKSLQTLGLNEQGFIELINLQKAYSILFGLFSPVIGYMAIHIFGGALYLFLWLLQRPQQNPISFGVILECAASSLVFMVFYMIPAIGPMIALIMVCLNVSRALFARYQLVGFIKIMSIMSAIYVSFFLTSATMQLLAQPVARMLKG